MAKCGGKLETAPYVCARESREADGSCCVLCSCGLHTPICNILTFPMVIGAEYLDNPNREADILSRLAKAVEACRLVEKEINTLHRIIWDLNAGHQHRTLQSLLHHLATDLRFIENEIKGIAG